MVPLLADFDGDNDTDGGDFLKWQRDDSTAGQLNDWQTEYGTNANAVEASHSVPEPTTLAITLLGSCTVLVCRRRNAIVVTPSSERHRHSAIVVSPSGGRRRSDSIGPLMAQSAQRY